MIIAAIDWGTVAGFSAVFIAIVGALANWADKRADARDRRESATVAATAAVQAAEAQSSSKATDRVVHTLGEMVADLRETEGGLRAGITKCERRCDEILAAARQREGEHAAEVAALYEQLREVRRQLAELKGSTS